MNVFKTPKGTVLELLTLKGKAYLAVQQRIRWFREEMPNWGIETQIIACDKEHAIFKATIKNEEGRIVAQATKSETPQGFADYVEKAETGAIGRALALVGFGTQFAVELEEGTERIVDSPVQTRHTTVPVKNESLNRNSIASYVIPFGKFKNHKFVDVPQKDLAEYIVWLEENAKKDKKTLSNLAQELKSAYEHHYGTNSHLEQSISEPQDLPF